MIEESNFEPGLWILIGVVAIIFLLAVVVGLCAFFSNFSSELKYLNIEIRRTSGSERRHYIRKRRRLWLSLLPFVKY